MFQYAAVETALMRAGEFQEEYRSAFGARINYFKRIGLLASTPGKGSRIVYREDDILLLALCIEFCQFGIEPKRAAMLARHLWRKVADCLLHDHGEDRFLAGNPMLVTASFMEARSSSDDVFMGMLPLDEDPANWIVTASDLPALLEQRTCVINLTSLGRRVRSALPQPTK